MKSANVLWFTGLSGAGKTTIAAGAREELLKTGKRVKVYDGDEVRNHINKHLDFTPEHIEENNRVIAELCRRDAESGLYDYIFAPVISPFERCRSIAKDMIGESFRLIYVKVSVDEAVKRDTKGLYKKALAGEIDNLIGLGNGVPYEPPEGPDLVLDTEAEDAGSSIKRLLVFIMWW